MVKHQRQLWEKTHNPWVVLKSSGSESSLVISYSWRDCPNWSLIGTSIKRQAGFAPRKTPPGLEASHISAWNSARSTALPLYAGGPGVLAGDFLKAASDLDVPIVGIGLLYQEGYFRQLLDINGAQQEFYPYNEPAVLPVEPVMQSGDGWLRISRELPGRIVQLRV